MAGRLFTILALAATLSAQVALFPLADVKPGLKGIGKTVFAGSEISEFQVEVLGVLENAGPKQSIILARLSGGPLGRTGVMQGMSGSPVYVEGKLMGAVALSFAFSKEPLAGIRPIEEMLRAGGGRGVQRAAVHLTPWERDLTRPFSRRREVSAPGARLVEIATPVSFSGFTQATIEHFAPQLRAIGLEPVQGFGGSGSDAAAGLGDPSLVRPGSMISVLLLSGDLNVGADGTVTRVDGDHIYAFGHRFLSVGPTDLPFTRSEVLTLAPNLATSFKISASRELMGTITGDYSTAVSGVLNRRAATIPVSIRVASPRPNGAAPAVSEYRIGLVNDRYLSPFLLQMALYSALDATERTVGSATLSLRGRIEFADGSPPVRVDDMYAGSANIPLQASLGVAAPLAYLMQAGFDSLRVKSISLAAEVFDERRQWVIDQAWPLRRTVRPGGEVELAVALIGENGEQRIRRVRYRVPIGAPEGRLHFTVADAMTTNLTEYMYLIGKRLQSPARVIAVLNGLRDSTSAYVRVWRARRGFRVDGESLPAPPPSVAMILGRGQQASAGPGAYTSKIDELTIKVGDAVVTGSKTVQVEVKQP